MIVLEALEIGLEIRIENNIFALGTDILGYKMLCSKVRTGEGSRFLECEYSLRTIIIMCEKLTDEEIFTLCADIALNKEKRASK
jgi:hypothetical protein